MNGVPFHLSRGMACTSCTSLLQPSTSIGCLQFQPKPHSKLLLSSCIPFRPNSKSLIWSKGRKNNTACQAVTETEPEENPDDKSDTSEKSTESIAGTVSDNENAESNSTSDKSNTNSNGPEIAQSLNNLEIYAKMAMEESKSNITEKSADSNAGIISDKSNSNNNGPKIAQSLSNLEIYTKLEKEAAKSKIIEKSAESSTGIVSDDQNVESNSISDKSNNNGPEIAQSLSNLEIYTKLEIEASKSKITEENAKKNEDLEGDVASGSPLPGMTQQLDEETMRIPKDTIDILKDQVFGFDTFFITSQEPYEGGVLFKGNLRGKPAVIYEKLKKRLNDKFGDEFSLFILINPEDEKPIAVIVPRVTMERSSTAVPEWFASGAFGLVTIFTLLLRNVPALQTNLLSTFDNLDLLREGVPGALVTALIVGFHEIAHLVVAKEKGIKLGIPYFVPSWQIGSYGAITRIISIVQNREDLLKFSVAGPIAGFSLGIVLLFLGFILPPFDGVGIVLDPSIFHESFLAGGIAKLMLGDALKEGTNLSINPLVLWAWAGLLINAINSIPAGELDGGRIAFSLWGRKISARLSSVTLGLLGISAIFSDVAFYWVVLIFFLQRGPVAPLSEEITDPNNKYVALGVAVLLLGLLVCAPYPFPFTSSGIEFDL